MIEQHVYLDGLVVVILETPRFEGTKEEYDDMTELSW